jgi:hypothetical protein
MRCSVGDKRNSPPIVRTAFPRVSSTQLRSVTISLLSLPLSSSAQPTRSDVSE